MTSFSDVDRLLGNDPFARHMGFRLVEFGPGRAVVEMDIVAEHLNFMGYAHGGAVFSLADMAFGLAANSREHASIGIDAHIAYVRGVKAGDSLVATAEEVSRGRSTAVYRVDVSRDGKTMSTFTGTVYVSDRPSNLSPGETSP